MDLELTGKSVVITGASRGIGLACALSFAAEGCHIRMVSRDPERLASARRQVLTAARGEVTAHTADFTHAPEVAAAIERFSDADILVNNAGEIPGGSILDVDAERWRAGWEAKVFGYIDATRAMLTHMYARGAGVIINVIGTGGVQHSYEYVAGSTANAGLMAFTDAVGSRSVDHGVRVVGVNPGAVETDRHRGILAAVAAKETGNAATSWLHYVGGDLPLGRAAQPEEIADVVTYLASARASYISGTVLNVDAGRLYR